jgi:hypothetical protein
VRRPILALSGALVLLAMGAGTAMADDPIQAVGQVAGNSQSANANAESTQQNPTNKNVSVRIFSPGDGGDVSQSNSSTAAAAAGNENATQQGAVQSGGGGTQAAEQGAYSDQSADADATSAQDHPTNSNISVRIDSPGDDGKVKQSNSSGAAAKAGNENGTHQDVDQSQGGGDHCCGGDGVQAIGQKAVSEQSADADATSVQKDPTNNNVSVRIASEGDDGDVEQSNSSAALALAGNENATKQDADQTQGGGRHCGCDGVQAIGQKAVSGQKADAGATSKQHGATNSNTPVRIKSKGGGGSVSQANYSAALALAGNKNGTKQTASQDQHGTCGCGGSGVQAAGQIAFNWQDADADATSKQSDAKNANAPVAIGSHTGGGSVKQANSSVAKALAFNANWLDQDAEQSQG